MENPQFCGYCLICQDYKDDDYGQWLSDKEMPIINPQTNKIVIVRGCRDCGSPLAAIYPAKEPKMSYDQEMFTFGSTRIQTSNFTDEQLAEYIKIYKKYEEESDNPIVKTIMRGIWCDFDTELEMRKIEREEDSE